ncbi:MAG: P-II family nitrogen regulator [Methanomicrobiales archaeon]
MKMVKAIIREERVPFVKKALADKNIYGMTILPAMGRGNQGGVHLQFRGGFLNIDMLPKVMMEIIIPDDHEEMVIHQILSSAKTGKEGDGKIFIIPVNESHRIRTGEVEV